MKLPSVWRRYALARFEFDCGIQVSLSPKIIAVLRGTRFVVKFNNEV